MKKIKYLLLVFLFFLSGCSISSLDKGIGSEDNPYLIYTVEDFMDFGGRLYHVEDNYEGKHFKLMNDLNFMGINYNPIGQNLFNSFDGHFDGNNHILRNITINSEEEYVGVFGVIGKYASVKNLKIENLYCQVNKAYSNIGGIAGTVLYGAEINNCQTSGRISASLNAEGKKLANGNNCGGIVGVAIGSVINSKSSMNIVGDVVGGICGKSYSKTINNCYYENGVIISDYIAGGIIGSIYNDYYSYINYHNLYSKNIQITADYIVGGAVGYTKGYTVFDNLFIETKIKVSNVDECFVGSFLGTGNGSNIYVRKSYAIIHADLKMKRIDSRAVIGFIAAIDIYAHNTVVKGYFNITNGKKLHYTTTIISSRFLVEDKNNVEWYNVNNQFYTKSSNNDDEIIVDTLKYDKSWIIKEDNYYFIKKDEDIFSSLEGEGTINNPYLIHTFDELNYLYVSKIKKYFKLANNIDTLKKGNKDIKFIQYEYTFNLDGNDYSINNYDLGESNGAYSGLFGVLNNSEIKNIKFENINVSFENDSLSRVKRYLFNELNNSIVENVDIDISIKSDIVNVEFGVYSLLKDSEIKNINVSGVIDSILPLNFHTFDGQTYNSKIIDNLVNIEFKNTNNLIVYLYGGINENRHYSNNIVKIYTSLDLEYFSLFYNQVNIETFKEEEIICYHNDVKIFPK